MLAKAQLEQGDQSFVLAGSEGREDQSTIDGERVEGVPVHRLPTPRGGDPIGLHPPTRDAIVAHVREIQADVVHIHHWHNLVPDLVQALAQRGFPCVVTLHDYYPTCPLFFRMTEDLTFCPPDVDDVTCALHVKLHIDAPIPELTAGLARRRDCFRKELEQAAAVVAISEAQASVLRRIPWVRDLNLRCVPLAPPPVLRAMAQPPSTNGAQLRIVTVGGLVPGKGFHVLVEACALLRNPELIEIYHFGAAPMEDYRRSIEARKDRVRMHLGGSFPDDVNIYAGFDVAAFPSLFAETHGYGVDEALAAGLPVLVSDRGAPPERVGGQVLDRNETLCFWPGNGSITHFYHNGRSLELVALGKELETEVN
jgi:glycosyltransferase involved in cell wall biosynthesis